MKRSIAKEEQRRIPFCNSPFLQDVTIELGRRSLKSVRRSKRTLDFAVSKEDVDGVVLERLDIEARDSCEFMTKITLWENGSSWVFCAKGKKNTPWQVAFETHANLAGMKAEQIAELIRGTLRELGDVRPVWEEHALQ